MHFAASGRCVALLLTRAALGSASAAHDMATLSSETRFMDASAAARELRAAFLDCSAAGAEVVYKKIDSTMRGNPGAGPAKPCAGEAPRGRLLAVVGSLTKTSLEQIDYAAAHGFQLLDLDTEAWAADAGAELARLAALAAADADRPLLLKNRVAPSGRIDVADGIRVAGMFAAAAHAVTVAGNCGVLYATGGSTAMAVLRTLGVDAVTLEREFMPGVVMSSFAPAGTKLRRFISKAGGFGGPETIARIAEAARG